MGVAICDMGEKGWGGGGAGYGLPQPVVAFGGSEAAGPQPGAWDGGGGPAWGGDGWW